MGLGILEGRGECRGGWIVTGLHVALGCLVWAGSRRRLHLVVADGCELGKGESVPRVPRRGVDAHLSGVSGHAPPSHSAGGAHDEGNPAACD